MTHTQNPAPAVAAPFAAMLRSTLIPMVATAPVIVVLFWLTRSARGGLAALLGVFVAVAFFAGGLYVMGRVTNANPFSVLAGAIAVYLGQVIFLGVVILTFSGASWLDGTSFGLSVLAVALIWQVLQVVAFLRLRQPVYDEPAEVPAGDPAGDSAGEPGPGPADGADQRTVS